MALIRYNGISDSIGALLASPFLAESVSLLVPFDGVDVRLSPQEAWRTLYGPQRDEPLYEAVWRQVIASAQSEPCRPGAERDNPRHLLMAWLALPRMSRTIRHVSARLRLDRRDAEAEALLALLDALPTVDPEQPRPVERLLKAARGQVWRTARRTARETPVADIAGLAGALRSGTPPEPQGHGGEDAWEVRITPPDRPDGLAAPLRFTRSRTRIEGERLGSLAEGLGLQSIVYRARRPGRGRRIGVLSLSPAGSGR